VRTDLATVHALTARWHVVPAHDPRAFADIPLLEAAR
jgi:hypothetical protein